MRKLHGNVTNIAFRLGFPHVHRISFDKYSQQAQRGEGKGGRSEVMDENPRPNQMQGERGFYKRSFGGFIFMKRGDVEGMAGFRVLCHPAPLQPRHVKTHMS